MCLATGQLGFFQIAIQSAVRVQVHGGIQLAQIEMERVLDAMVGAELERRRATGEYRPAVPYSSICHYFGCEKTPTPVAMLSIRSISAHSGTHRESVGGCQTKPGRRFRRSLMPTSATRSG